MQAGDVVAQRFELLDVAGRGGMGVVYKAKDRLTQGFAAVKLLNTQVPDLARFEREAEVLATVKHEAVVRYLAHGEAGNGQRFLAMEWLEGEDLGRRLMRGPLTIDEAVTLGLGLASALEAIHAQGIVHRDLKPQNLFLLDGKLERLRLLDFGIARRPGAQLQKLTKTGALMGTPTYMPPEQVRGHRDLDARADIYAFGCVLWECLTGEPPFVGEHVMAVLARVLLEVCPPLRARLGDVPPELDALVEAMTSKDLARRPDAKTVGAALAKVPRGRALARAAARITGHEQRLVCVVAGGEPAAAGTESTIPRDERQKTHEQLQQVAARFSVRLEHVPGGAFFACFVGGSAATDLVADAARCALALRPLSHGHGLVVATGRAVVEDGRVPLGEVVDRAASVLLATPADVVKIDSLSAALIDARFIVEGDRLLGERGAEVEEVRPLLGLPTPFVGRERELSTLEALVDEALSDPGARVALVTAPAGFGKTRLRTELMKKLRESADLTLCLGRGEPQRQDSSHALLVSALRRTFSLDDAMDDDVRARRIAERVAEVLPGAEGARVGAFLAELMESPASGEPLPEVAAARREPRLMADQVRAAFEAWVLAETKRRPLVLVLEDLHWGDPGTVRLVDAALRAAKDRPFFVLALARPEVTDRFPKLWAERGLQHVALGELRARAAEQLVKKVLGARATDSVVGQLVSRAAGNAFYLEELIRQVAATGRADALPESVVAMAQLRLEGLASEQRALLRAGAVFGEVFWERGVAALTGGGELGDALSALVDREVLTTRPSPRFAGEREFAFRHALLRDAAYAMLTESDRASGHQLAGRWLEEVGERDHASLARHYQLGQDLVAAARCYASAAESALMADDLQNAGQLVKLGLAAAPKGETLERLLDTDVQVQRWGSQDFDGARVFELLDLATPGSKRWSRALGDASLLSPENGGVTAGALRKRYLEATPATGEEVEFAICGARMAGHLSIIRRGQEGSEVLERAATFAAGRLTRDPALTAFMEEGRAFIAADAARFPDSVRGFRTASEGFSAAGDVRNQCSQLNNLCFAYRAIGQHRELSELCGRIIAISERAGLAKLRARTMALVADCELERGDLEALRTHPANLFPSADQVSGSQARYMIFVWARIVACSGRHAEALALLGKAPLQRVIEHGHSGYSLNLAWTQCEAGDGARALEALEAPGVRMSIFEDLRFPVERPWLEGRARLLLGQRDQGRACLRRALEALAESSARLPSEAREPFLGMLAFRQLRALAAAEGVLA